MNELRSILNELTRETTVAAVLATLVSVAGSSYRRPGARLLIKSDGRRFGSISGGCLEEDIVARARGVFATGKAELVTYDTTSENDVIWGVGLGCHGVVQVLIEKVSPNPKWARVLQQRMENNQSTELIVVWQTENPTRLGTRLIEDLADVVTPGAEAAGTFRDVVAAPVRLVVFGAGDDARPLVRLAKELGWHVTVADPRRDLVNAERFPSADVLVMDRAADLVGRALSSPETISVVMTHHYVHDLPILQALLPASQSYIGLLGPKKRGDRILADLATTGEPITPEQRARLHTPVGFDLGAETPHEVALSIVAEIQAFLTGRDGRPLKQRTRPIHA